MALGVGILLAGPSEAAHEAAIPSAGEVALANPVARALPGGAWEGNPALSGGLSGWRFGAGSTHPLGFSDLDLMGIWMGRGRNGWRPGWSARWSNFEAGDLYREDLLGLDMATGKDSWQVGAGWRGGRTAFGNAGADWTQGWALGVLVRPAAPIALAGAWEDRSGIHTEDPRLAQPWVLRLGAAVEPSDSLWASHLGLEKKQGAPLGWSIGQELRWKILVLRGGMRLEPWVLSIGAGIRWRSLVLDWTQEGDSHLGWQQHWTISVVP